VIRVRSETDLYGYSKWLSEYCGVENERPSWNFQHMWIWWDFEDRDVEWAFDPNHLNRSGSLVQNQAIADVIIAREHPSLAVGLPFLQFNKYHPVEAKRNGKTLYASTHSTAWRDVSQTTLAAVQEFSKNHDVTVMLSLKDLKIAPLLSCPYVVGACATDPESFYRIQKLFSEYEYLISDRMGSHILYALACGMKVGLSAKYNIDTVFSEVALRSGLESRAREIRDTQFLADRFPGLVIEDDIPKYTTMPDIAVVPPEITAQIIWS